MVRVLFDQGTPVGLRGHLGAHGIDTLSERGWDRKKNGEMLDLAEQAGYETLVTTDRNLQHQQNLRGRRIGIVVLVMAKWPDVVAHTVQTEEAIRTTGPGEVTEVQCGGENSGKKNGRGRNKRRRPDRDDRGR